MNRARLKEVVLWHDDPVSPRAAFVVGGDLRQQEIDAIREAIGRTLVAINDQRQARAEVAAADGDPLASLGYGGGQ